MPKENLGNSKKPFENENDEMKLLNIKRKNRNKTSQNLCSDHKRLRFASVEHDKNMIDILSEAIDLWIEKHNN